MTLDHRRRLLLLLVPIIVVGVLGTIADWLAPSLIVHHPLLEIAFNPKIRYLALAAGRIPAPVWFGVAFGRLVAVDPFWYLLGRWYGEDAVRWIDRRFRGGRALRLIERWFSRASWPIVLVAPDGVICLLAGATGMSAPTFVALDFLGTVARLVLIRLLADALAGPLTDVGRYLGRYAWWLVGLSLVVGGFQLWRRLRARQDHTARNSHR